MRHFVRRVENKTLYYLSEYFPEVVTKRLYYRTFKKNLALDNPKTFNEKLQWLKLREYNNNPLVTLCADKHSVREYVIKSGCSEILNEIYFSWSSPNEIIWHTLPDKFVLKCNHGAGYNIVCKDKNLLNPNQVKKKLSKWMAHDYWKLAVELCYKHIPKKIICEKFIETKSGHLPYDYKVFCFNGKPLFVMLCTERETSKPKYYFVDKDWNVLPYGLDYLKLNDSKLLEKPEGYLSLFYFAEKLAKPFPFVRADFYLNDGKIIFGELTFVPAAGLDIELNNENMNDVDETLGNLLDLNNYINK
ncbi:hypothetical protein Xbed_02572 [Xenorhabdus beddingii]|uniref:Glycosyl transferase n=1 Tax=Xenorhabdus beddingii TaxID=40578 RepID=A0A1Y2SMJ1_9GAMM|nr:ATP-grasp fold amidoligase family protein [Xenorhabdus beddingii]OTA19175.1 hypothetical protein Xbed_02572 [Xenorhabdus beddingii]